ncbi:SAM-dependent methyltransferase [Brevibacillus invocatus]|uniref:SAM-dependent methyltransferase n=1 Tax=Brevibacillus invocatus TaxID=173959 RepID=A0A3M8C8F0_9BACL|nr:SAM-dependent methyltransferase [Brevibacillus invocatus]RNB71994.1 SAM-dependent methyltransferase [Brevibacillus invocatus]
MSRERVKLDINRIVFIGRTFDEYLKMFDLTQEELTGKRVLDCPAGACSFTAIAGRNGLDVTATDIAYDHSVSELENKGFLDIEHAMEQMEKTQSNYVWNEFRSVAELKQHRSMALTACVKDMRARPERYVPATLPQLPFSVQEFDITLSAHFLFMYADRLDYAFHVQTIHELMRVTRSEIRIFPLVDLSGRRYASMDCLLDFVRSQGWSAEECEASYQFQKGARTMLRMQRLD